MFITALPHLSTAHLKHIMLGCWRPSALTFLCGNGLQLVSCSEKEVQLTYVQHATQRFLLYAEAEGALEAFISVISGPPGPRPEAIFDRVGGPILLLWGQRDEVTPLDGPVARFMKAAADSRPHTQFKILQGTQDS